MKKIKKVLVANRGEIALRVMRTCREIGIATVAVYSSADRSMPHVRFADEAYLLGEPAAKLSYLNQEKIVEVAARTGADAIHPGYGFLSENAGFAEKVKEAGVIFIGPTPEAIRLMGDKTNARKMAKSVHIPIVPGTEEPIASYEEARATALAIGYPILLKAAGGGGGKGMRIVHAEGELESHIRASQSEARSAFGDERVFIEKYIQGPRHIEVQVLADHFGNVVHLGERECSIQRRHQKVIEESPSPAVDEALRQAITSSAVRLISASGYTNAGTLEFIMDKEKNFYFLEMNTRLQVEHPVTEMRTGRDLVKEQILIASNNPLSFQQKDVTFQGHSIECRIYAEDPDNNFFPSTGGIVRLRPAAGNGVREDRGVEEGNEISTYYDPLIAKLIVWAESRPAAIAKMKAALGAYELFGVRNNLTLCEWVIGHPDFAQGICTTHFLQDQFTPEKLAKPGKELLELAAAAALTKHTSPSRNAVAPQNKNQTLWKKQRKDLLH